MTCASRTLIIPGPQWLITPAQNLTLQGTLSPWRNARNEAAAALQAQTADTAAMPAAFSAMRRNTASCGRRRRGVVRAGG